MLLPAVVAFVWWRWWGMSDAAWVVVAVAIPMTLLYVLFGSPSRGRMTEIGPTRLALPRGL
jgi:hypothetical protein